MDNRYYITDLRSGGVHDTFCDLKSTDSVSVEIKDVNGDGKNDLAAKRTPTKTL